MKQKSVNIIIRNIIYMTIPSYFCWNQAIASSLHLVSDSDSSWSDLTSSNSISRSDQNYVEIHTKNTCVWNNIKV